MHLNQHGRSYTHDARHHRLFSNFRHPIAYLLALHPSFSRSSLSVLVLENSQDPEISYLFFSKGKNTKCIWYLH